MALSQNHVRNFCQSDLNSNRSLCKYLTHRTTKNGYVPVCTKLCPSQQSKSPWGTGDNCKGYPLMMYVEQGYDVVEKE